MDVYLPADVIIVFSLSPTDHDQTTFSVSCMGGWCKHNRMHINFACEEPFSYKSYCSSVRHFCVTFTFPLKDETFMSTSLLTTFANHGIYQQVSPWLRQMALKVITGWVT